MIEMIVATLWQPRWSECVRSWTARAEDPVKVRVIPDQTIIHAYEKGRLESTYDILGYVHDDVLIHETCWDLRVVHEFRDQEVAMVGFGGALGHANSNLYTTPYHLPNLARQAFMSNMRDAEKHGARFAGERDVSVLDGFAVFIRRSFLDQIGGWPQDGRVGYFMYTEFMCCMARRMQKKIRLVGVDCEHLGGRSSGLKPEQKFDYDGEHLYIYKEFRDVLPWTVTK